MLHCSIILLHVLQNNFANVTSLGWWGYVKFLRANKCFCTPPRMQHLWSAFSPSSFQCFLEGKKGLTLILGLLVWFGIKPSSSQHLSSTPIFNSYETSNYAAIQVAFHKTQCCPLEHGEVLYELKGQAACFQVEQIQVISLFLSFCLCIVSNQESLIRIFKCILIYQIRRTNDWEHTWSW